MVVRTLVAFGLVLMLVREAPAATVLVSPPNNFSSVGLTCLIANVGTKNVTVRIEIIDDFGGIVGDSGEVVVAPNLKTAFYVGSETNPDFCRFTLVKGSKTNVRAIADLYETFSGKNFLLPAN